MSLAVVQAVSNAYKFDGSTTTPKFTWGATPTNGNLLVVQIASWSGAALALASGWKLYASNTSGAWQMYFAYKYAGASEPTTVTIDTNSHIAWALNAWEISGVTGTYWKDIIRVTLSITGQAGPTTSIAPASFTTETNTTLALYSLTSYSQTASTTYSWSGGWTPDSQFCTATADGSNALFDYGASAHQVISGPTALTPTITPNHSSFWGNSIIELGNTNGPTIDLPGVVGAQINGAINTPLTSLTTPTFSEATFPAVIVAIVNAGCFETGASPPSPPFTTSVSGLGLTWNLRGRSHYVNGSQVQQEMTVWWAEATGAVSGTFTANFTGLSGSSNFGACASIDLFAALGVQTPATPWDTDPAFPQFFPPPGTTTTLSHPDLMIGQSVVTVANNATPIGGALTWQSFFFNGSGSGGGSVIQNTISSYSYQGSTVSGASVTNGAGGSGATVMYIDALAGSSGETGAVTFSLTEVSFNIAASDTSFANKHATMALSGVAFSAVGGREETATATLALLKAAFNVHETREETATVSLALSGVTLTIFAQDLDAITKLRQFHTFG